MKAKDNQITNDSRIGRHWVSGLTPCGISSKKHIPIYYLEEIKDTDTILYDCPEIETQIMNWHGKSYWVTVFNKEEQL